MDEMSEAAMVTFYREAQAACDRGDLPTALDHLADIRDAIDRMRDRLVRQSRAGGGK